MVRHASQNLCSTNAADRNSVVCAKRIEFDSTQFNSTFRQLAAMAFPWLVTTAVVAVATAVYVQHMMRSSSQHHETAVYVIGDLHGDVDCAKYWVGQTGLISSIDGKWKDPTSKLVFLGDYVDKGIQSRQVVEFVKYLTEKYPQNVIALMGNHELELLRDRTEKIWGHGIAGYFQLPYAATHPAEYLNYLDHHDNTDERVVELLYNASAEVYGNGLYRSVFFIPEDRDGSILQLFPDGMKQIVQQHLTKFQQAYLDRYRSGTELGNFLESLPIVAIVGDTVFTHGGISPDIGNFVRTRTDVDQLNREFAANSNEAKLAQFLETRLGRVVYSLLTYRGNHKEGACSFLSNVLPEQTQRLAVGHTPSGNVRLLCDDQFLALDSALSRWFRNSGNDYCPGHRRIASTNGRYQCQRIASNTCHGQIVKIVQGHVQVVNAQPSFSTS